VHRAVGSGPRCPWCFLWIDHAAQAWYRTFNTAPDQDGLPVLTMVATALAHLASPAKFSALAPPGGCCNNTFPRAALLSSLRAAWLAAKVAAAYVFTCACVGFVWGRARGYPYFFFGDRSVFVNTHNDYVPSAASLAKSLAVGTWGGMFWSAVDLAVLCLSALVLFGLRWAVRRTVGCTVDR
jgi:hypothetical protein